MSYTKNQHLLSQWWLRNFRADESTEKSKDKQRIWCHEVYFEKDKGPVTRDIPLQISSIALKKDCFTLIDRDTNKKFDIEEEITIFERRSSNFVNRLIHDNEFDILLENSNSFDAPLQTILNLMIIQFLLNLHNPQNKNSDKEEVLNQFVYKLIENFEEIKSQITNPPIIYSSYFEKPIYKKLQKVVNSKSSKEDICNVLFILFIILSSEGLPSLTNDLDNIKRELFDRIYIEGIHHTGFEFTSNQKRPVFSISPNIFAIYDSSTIYLPLSHNFAIQFSIKSKDIYNTSINIYSPNPEKFLRLKNSKFNVYKTSYDFIDGIIINLMLTNMRHTNTAYTPFSLADIEEYLDLQRSDYNFYHQPSSPVLLQ